MTKAIDFFSKLDAAVARNQSLLCVGLDPSPERLPERFRRPGGDLFQSLLAWNRSIIDATADKVCCFKPNIAFYEALGAPGMELLRQTLSAIPRDVPVLLDAKRGDIGSTAAAYARACFEELGVDAVTLSPYLGRDSIDPFAAYPGKGLFVLCHTSNPSASEFQTRLVRTDGQERPLFLLVADIATRWSPQVGLVVGATYPQALRQVRDAAPDAWILAPGVGAQGGDLEAALAAGLRADGSGVLVAVTRGVTMAADPAEAAETLRRRIQQARTPAASPVPSRMPISQVQALSAALHELGAIKFGAFTLASGMESPFYIDLRLLVSRPRLLEQVAEAYASLLRDIPHDRIAGVPYAALPIGTAVALAADAPLIYPRKEVKQHGLGKDIEGQWAPGDRVVIIEDLITSGGSTLRTAERLRAAGLVVEDVIVLIDREQGGVENLAAAGIRAHCVFRLRELLDALVDLGRLDPGTRTQVLEFVDQHRAGGR